MGSLKIGGQSALPIDRPEQILGVAVRGMDFYLKRASDSAVVASIPFDQAGGMNPALALSPAATGGVANYRLSFRQGFAGSFNRRNTGTTAQDPTTLANQDTPGTDYHTESGFYSAALPSTDGIRTTPRNPHNRNSLPVLFRRFYETPASYRDA